ncbi:hypothetical protein [Brevibacillus sp. AF8]|uniref:hypothetical protein n=1 Tax=Brevibacillus sp. AF8 TaxID=2825881 RepID=UPI001E445DC7|nr:hypothetical protein [Brevibacillus sp. AF8]MCE0453028.1 hypothetical protein [Brevibacillus sp. AF8]
MFIESVLIRVETEKELYVRFVPFRDTDGTIKEFSMIYGENTLGKSTFIQSVIFALKGEDLYGTRQNDILSFKDLFRIHYKRKVIQAHVFLQLSNKGTRVVVARNALDWNDPVCVFSGVELQKSSNLEQLVHESKTRAFYKMRKDKNIKGNETYQEFLFSFMDITPITESESETSGEDSESTGDVKLLFYIQNLMPLFVIQQEAWYDIQAINPRYGLKDIKKTAFEVLLQFSGTEVITARHELEKLLSLLKQKTTSLNDINDVIGMIALKDTKLIEDEIARTQTEILNHEQSIERLESGSSERNNVFSEIRNKFRISSMKARRHREEMQSLETEIEEYNFFINKILNDIEKNDKLKTAKKIVGILPVSSCPRCLNALSIDVDDELESGNCGLCGSPFKSIPQAQSEQYLGYLKDELRDFNRLKEIKEKDKEELYNKVVLAELEQAELKRMMDDFEDKLKPRNLQEYNFHARQIGKLQNSITHLNKDKEIIERFEKLLKEKEDLEKDIKDKRAYIKGIEKQKEKDEEKIQFFERTFKTNLKNLSFLKLGLDEKKIKEEKKKDAVSLDDDLEKIYGQITIDRFDYLPKLEGRNLYYLTSSSGLIRIILSYYVALLETALNYEDSVQHPLLLLMDEPRQQNLDIKTFNCFIDLFRELEKKYQGKFQVIIASSEKGSVSDTELALDLGADTYLLQPLDDDTESELPIT